MMRNIFFLVLSFFVLTSHCVAQTKLTNVGFAAFNITAKRFNCSGLLASMAPLDEWHVAFLYNTFGNNFSCLDRLLDEPKLKTLEIALLNEPGHRNRRLGSYEFLRTVGSVADWQRVVERNDGEVKKRFIEYVQPLKTFLANNLRNDVQLLINPGLESNLNDKAGANLIAWTREAFPEARVVWNPLVASPGRRTNTKADFIEGHGFNPNLNEPCVYNMDGTDVSYPTRPAIGEPQYREGQTKNWVKSGPPLFQLIESYANKCEIALIWVAESNGIDYRTSKFVDPRRRNHFVSNSVYRRIIKDVINLQKIGVVYPVEYNYTPSDLVAFDGCTQILDNFIDGEKRGNLLKQSEFPDRGGVLILPPTFRSVSRVRLVQGATLIDTYSNAGAYKDGRALFRSKISPTKYPLKSALIIEKNSSKICYKIPNPRIRLD